MPHAHDHKLAVSQGISSALHGMPRDQIAMIILRVLQERRPINWDEIDGDFPMESETDRRMWLAVDALASVLDRPNSQKRRRLRERTTDLLAAQRLESLTYEAAA